MISKERGEYKQFIGVMDCLLIVFKCNVYSFNRGDKDMNLDGLFYTKKCTSYSEKLKNCIEASVKKLDEIGQNPLMLLGKIQSGKTRAFIGVISLAFDNGYDFAIVLTKNSNALAKQTVSRMNSEFSEFIDDDELDVYDIIKMPDKLSRYELGKKMILVVKKQHKNLPKLLEFIKTYAVADTKKCLVIDDEADFTSVGFDKDKESEEFDLRVIASQINDLRIKLESKFIQVTATPYSLFLQPNDIFIRGEVIERVKPMHTILVPHGQEYIGGDFYFNDLINQDKDDLYYRIYEDELEILKKHDRRRLKEEEALTSNKIEGLRSAIINFMVGGCIRILQSGEKAGKNDNKFSFIVHTETAKASHARQLDLIDSLIEQIEIAVENDSEVINELVNKSYSEFTKVILKQGSYLPEKTQVFECFKAAVCEEWVSSIGVNSEHDIDTLLDDDGQLKRRTPLTIFVGGQILDRGITIANLIGFYYGRRPKKSQQDTVLQHSRMFGYRKKEDLAVTKFYTTIDLYERMVMINDFDNNLRQDIENNVIEHGIYFISRDVKGKVIPCSPNKIALSNTRVIKKGKSVHPVGFSTFSNTRIKSNVKKIEDILRKYNGEISGEYLINKEDALKIIEYSYDCLEIENEHTFSHESFKAVLNHLSKDDVYVVCGLNREISKFRAHRYSNIPYSEGDKTRASQNAINRPALILTRQIGTKELGWSDAPFWWPALIVQENAPTSVYADIVMEN